MRFAVDAHAIGRHLTGNEVYIRSLLTAFAAQKRDCDFVAYVSADVARHYAAHGMISILPIQLTCTVPAFGIITRTDWILSPAAKVVLKAIKTAAISAYDNYSPAA